jgi:hypothetical protein
MNGMFQNSRGLGDLAKHSHIADGCRDYDLDFIAISETGRRNFSQSFLDRYQAGLTFSGFLTRLVVGPGVFYLASE